MVKAYAITTVHRAGPSGGLQVVPASTSSKVSVFDASATEFKELEALNAVRKATTEEIAVAKAQAAAVGNSIETADDDENLDGDTGNSASSESAQKPDSGAAGDPQSRPAKASKATKPAANPAPSSDDLTDL